MDNSFFELLLSKVKVPERVTIRMYDNKYPFVTSVENTNDTWDWFHVNSAVLEKILHEHGLTWCYIFETAPNKIPCIYMFFGQGLSKELMEEVMDEERSAIGEGRKLYFEDDSFSSIDVDQYDNSISEFERELRNKASDVFVVYKP